MKTSILIDTTTASGKKGRKTVTDINPNAENAAVKNFAQQLVALTTDTYGSTSKVNVDALQPASALQNPVVVFAYNVDEDGFCSATTGEYAFTAPANKIKLNKNLLKIEEAYGTARPVLLSAPAGAVVSAVYSGSEIEEEFWEGSVHAYAITFYSPSGNEGLVGDYVFQFPETDTYAATNFTLTVTA